MASPLSYTMGLVTTPLENAKAGFQSAVSNATGQASGLVSNALSYTPFNPNGSFLGGTSLGGNPNDAPGSFKVKLVSVLQQSQGATWEIRPVVFEVTPQITENRIVEYSPVSPIHMPGSIQIYKNTGSRSFEISAHFISRSPEDALANMKYVQTLRSWTLPFFGMSNTDISPGKSSASQLPSGGTSPQTEEEKNVASIAQVNGSLTPDTSGVDLIGAPPEVLYLYGYSTTKNDKRDSVIGVNLNRIPVVITNLGITYSEDVDYIPVQSSANGHTEPFPVKLDVSISLVETHSPVEYEQFSLASYKSGKLRNF